MVHKSAFLSVEREEGKRVPKREPEVKWMGGRELVMGLFASNDTKTTVGALDERECGGYEITVLKETHTAPIVDDHIPDVHSLVISRF